MAKAFIYKFLITDRDGEQRVEVTSDTLIDAIQIVKGLASKNVPILRIDLIEKVTTPYQLLGTE